LASVESHVSIVLTLSSNFYKLIVWDTLWLKAYNFVLISSMNMCWVAHILSLSVFPNRSLMREIRNGLGRSAHIMACMIVDGWRLGTLLAVFANRSINYWKDSSSLWTTYLRQIVTNMAHKMLNELMDWGYTSAEIDFYLALYASVVQEPKHIMARWHFCNFRQLLCLGSA